MTGRGRWLLFIVGFVAGMTVLVVALFGLLYLGSAQAWLLRVNTNGISEKIEGAAQIMAVEMLPDYLEAIKADVPALVGARVKNQFGDVKFQLGGEEFSLPEELVQRLEDNYRDTLISSIYDLLGSLPVDEMSAELGQEIAGIVENSLYAEFNSRTVDIEILGDYITIPLQIELVNQPGGGSFKLEFYWVDALAEH
ncbi:MAG: hypothetical protein ACOX2G_02230 [Bacillota bacterium]|jgi:hypothetical protein